METSLFYHLVLVNVVLPDSCSQCFEFVKVLQVLRRGAKQILRKKKYFGTDCWFVALFFRFGANAEDSLVAGHPLHQTCSFFDQHKPERTVRRASNFLFYLISFFLFCTPYPTKAFSLPNSTTFTQATSHGEFSFPYSSTEVSLWMHCFPVLWILIYFLCNVISQNKLWKKKGFTLADCGFFLN